MKLRISKTGWKALGGVFASGVLVLSFQNCGQAGFDTGTDDSLSSLEATTTGNAAPSAALVAKYGQAEATLVAGIPFAFQADFDQIAYNSCAGSYITAGDGFWTIMAGAYNTGGLTYGSDFWTYMNANFTPEYPSTVLTDEQIKEFMADAPRTSGAIPNLAVRTNGDFDTVHSTSSTPVLGTDYVEMLGDLSDPLYMQGLTTQGVLSNYMTFGANKVLEASLTYNSSLNLALNFRNDLMNTGMLTLSYMEDTSTTTVRAPQDYDGSGSTTEKSVIWGRGYSIQFGSAATNEQASPAGSLPSNMMTQVRSFDLANPTVALATWNCPQSLRLMVVRQMDQPSACPPENFESLANSSYLTALAIVRRQLRPDQWDVNLTYGCAVPKMGVSCYDESTIDSTTDAIIPVQYDRTHDCYDTSTGTGRVAGTGTAYSGTDPLQNGYCAQFITICTSYSF